jgi:hypothetical protein
MKKFFLLVFSTAVFNLSLKAQTIGITSEGAPIKLISTPPVLNPPLVIINGFETDMQSSVLDPKSIRKLDVLMSKAVIAQYGEKAKNGVLLITIKAGTEFYTIADFINAEKGHNTSVKQIELDGRIVPDMNKIIIDKKAFSGTMISSNAKTDEKNCDVVFSDTLVITTKYGPVSNN